VADSGGGMKWLKYGCLGCAGVVVLFLVLIGGVTGLAWVKSQDQQIVERQLDQELSAPEPAVPSDVPSQAATVDLPDLVGTVILDLANAEFEVEPGLPGEPLHVEANYDERNFELEQNLQEAPDGTWTYRLSFQPKGWSIVSALSQLFSGTQPKASIRLPVDVPMDLDLVLSRGGADVNLAGLWLTNAKIDVDKGGLQLKVREPLRAPMDHLSITTRMGGVQLVDLGNASPRRLEVNCHMGGAEIGLRGQWTRDAEITLESSMGGALVYLPDQVIIEGLASAGFDRRPQREIPPPTLRFIIDAGNMSDFDFVD